jgi:hypothetical protein
MRQLQTLAFTLFTLPFALGAQTNSQASSPLVLPSVTAYALDRVKVTLPADFAAPLNLLILSFQRDQQPAVDGWVPVVTQINGTNIRVQPWLLPVGPRENILYRWWLNASLRGSLAASQPRHYTVPLYVDKPAFLRSLKVPSEQQIVVLVTDRAGHVLWREAGPVTDNKKAALTHFLSASSH